MSVTPFWFRTDRVPCCIDRRCQVREMVDPDENSEIHYIYQDQEYILNQRDAGTELRDLLCADGSRAILVDGQYLVTDSSAILLREGDTNFTQYYVSDDAETFAVDAEDSITDSVSETADCVQLVEQDDSSIQQIIYYAQDAAETVDELTPVQDLLEGDVESIQDEDGNIYPFKRIKLEGQMLNFDEFIQRQDGVASEQSTSEGNSVEYAILGGDSYQEECYNLQEMSENTDETDEAAIPPEQPFDLSKITGRNLITGQTVTLHSYMEKLKKRLKSVSGGNLQKRNGKKLYPNEAKQPELDDLLDKKISIGKTKSGKKIVARIIHVERKGSVETELTTEDLLCEEESPECVKGEFDGDDEVEQTKILVKKSSVSKESFEQISKTLGGVMEMESVRKKLENKNLVVKLVEKKYCTESDSVIKSTSYSYGYMERDSDQGEADKWKFVPDQDTQDALLGDEATASKPARFSITTSLTIVVSQRKGGNRTIRVNLNPAPDNLCTVCAKFFKTNLQLRIHMHEAHNTYGLNCELCDESFDDVAKLKEHRDVHIQEGKLFICSECTKCFTSHAKFQKHLPTHDLFLRPLECSVCWVRCASEWALKKHLLTHTGLKPFECDICGKQFMTQYDVNFHKKIHFPEKHFACNICLRTFSRHSNLLRHAEIHKGSGALYKCDICFCSYNYISSLTRHMVQNHMGTADFRKKARKVDA